MKEEFPEQHIKEQLNNLDFDLKAETFASYLMGIVPLDFSLSDYFKRRFSKDITEVIPKDDKDSKLEIHLSRRSFYNIFPERFFHATYRSTPFVETMVADYKNRKLEEENTRKFFKPLEEEFFLHRIDIESDEDDVFKSLGSPELVNFLTDLWNIDQMMPKDMAAKILKTMPFMYKIAGNLPLLKTVLENIVQEQITIAHDHVSIVAKKSIDPWQLGVNMATSGRDKTFLPKYIFTINNIRRPNQIGDYLPQGKIISVMKFFIEHTLPFESDFEINFTVAKPKRQFVMSEAIYAGRLGVSATI